MFEWFYGHPEIKVQTGFEKLEKLIASTPLTSSEMKVVFAKIQAVVKNLTKDEEHLWLKEEKILEKIRVMDENFVGSNIHKISAHLSGSAHSLKDSFQQIVDGIDLALEDHKLVKETMNTYRELVRDDLNNIKNIIEELVTNYDILRHIHLTHDEIEFYTQKSRDNTRHTIDPKTNEIDYIFFINTSDEYILFQNRSKAIEDENEDEEKETPVHSSYPIQKWENFIYITGKRSNKTPNVDNDNNNPEIENNPLAHSSNQEGNHGHIKHVKHILGIKDKKESQFSVKSGMNKASNMNFVWELERKGIGKWQDAKKYIVGKILIKLILDMGVVVGFNANNNNTKTNIMKLELEYSGGKVLIHGYPYEE